MPSALAACMAAVTAFYQLPPQALPAIRAVENGHSGIVRHNQNGSDDLGVMQINTLWLPILAHSTGLSRPRLRRALINQDCFNVAVAGGILRIYLHETGDLLAAIGTYHSHTPALREAYQLRVLSLSPMAVPSGRTTGRTHAAIAIRSAHKRH